MHVCALGVFADLYLSHLLSIVPRAPCVWQVVSLLLSDRRLNPCAAHYTPFGGGLATGLKATALYVTACRRRCWVTAAGFSVLSLQRVVGFVMVAEGGVLVLGPQLSACFQGSSHAFFCL